MKRDPETYELFPADSEARALLAGLCGALIGAAAFGFCAGVHFGIYDLRLLGDPFRILVLPFVCAFFAFVLYCAVAPIFFLIGFVFSHLTGHAMDLRALAVLKASATVYVPFSYYVFGWSNRPTASSFSNLSEHILTTFLFLVPAMTFVSIGAWIWADGQVKKSLLGTTPLQGRFQLRTLFGATFLLALLLFLNQLAKINIMFWIDYLVLLMPVSLLTALIVWVRRSWPQRLHRKTGSDSPKERSETHREAFENHVKSDNKDS